MTNRTILYGNLYLNHYDLPSDSPGCCVLPVNQPEIGIDVDRMGIMMGIRPSGWGWIKSYMKGTEFMGCTQRYVANNSSLSN